MHRPLAIAVASLALVAGCSSGGTPASGASPSSTVPSTPAPHPMTHEDKRFLRTIFEGKNHVTFPLSDACPSGVRYDDQACGAQLTGMNATADSVIRVMGDYVPDSQTQLITDRGQTVLKTVKTVTELGCFGLGDAGKHSSADSLNQICPTLGPTASLTYLAFQAALSS
jgi:hypothetical protein